MTKLFSDSKEFKQELGIYKRIAKIDPEDKYFVKAVKGCYANFENIIKHPAEPTKKCEMLQNYEKKKNLPQIILPYAGTNIVDYLFKGKIKFSFDKWLPLAINLVEAIAVLRDHKICHFDIKADNIMFHNNKALLTDFGLSTSYENMYVPEANPVYNKLAQFSEYVMWPPEIHWEEFKYLKIKEYFMRKFNGEYTSKDIGKFYTEADIKTAANQLKILIETNKYTDIKKIFNEPTNIEKIDLFSLGMTFIYLHRHIDFTKSSKTQTDNYMKIVCKMTDFNYTKRARVDDTLKALKALKAI